MRLDRVPAGLRLAAAGLAALVAALALFELTSLDVRIQDHFYDADRLAWLVDRNEPVARMLFYTGPKAVIITLGVGMIILLAGPARWRRRLRFERMGLALAVATLATVPAFVGWLKATTGVPCPSDIRRYGGDMPYVRVLDRLRQDYPETRRGRCFPAGHASGGFALLGLTWLHPDRRWRVRAIAIGLGVGWTMAAYQMLKGAHFLSHTVVTMLIAAIMTCTMQGTVEMARRRKVRALSSGSPE